MTAARAPGSDGADAVGTPDQPPLSRGVLKTFYEREGYGFIQCPEIWRIYNRDVFVVGTELPPGAKRSDALSFVVVLNSRGQPQAQDVTLASLSAAAAAPRSYLGSVLPKDQHLDEFFCGFLKTLSRKDGYGFIQCDYLHDLYDRDTYVRAAELTGLDVCCGSLLRFQVMLNNRRQPQARFVSLVDTSAQDVQAVEALLPGLDSFEECASAGQQSSTVGRLVSWNILAPAYASCSNFPEAVPVALRWSRRAAQIRAVMGRLEPDVVCLQEAEVDRSTEELGLRVGDGPDAMGCSVCRRPGGRSDACMVFWRTDRLQMLREWHVSYDDHLPDVDPAKAEHFRTGHVAVVVELRAPRGESIVVATTHLACGPLSEDARLWQLSVLLNTLQTTGCRRVVICGDFNCVPGGKVHELMSKTFLSAYRDVERTSATATNAMSEGGKGFAETIDYCWLRIPYVQLQRRLRLPSKEELRTLLDGPPAPAPMPTLVAQGSWPSDHLPVAVDIAFGPDGLPPAPAAGRPPPAFQ